MTRTGTAEAAHGVGGDAPAEASPVAAGTLYVVATPIGTLDDLSPRAARVLAAVDCIIAEDTRQTRKILQRLAVTTRVRALHEHNERHLVPALVEELRQGKSLALVSDAGTPLLCDPGFRLVRACRDAAIPVLAVPGPSAITAALSVAGLPPYPFTFVGFLPATAVARRREVATLAEVPHTLVLFLSPHRLAAELAACAEGLGAERPAVLLAELSKLHERAERGSLGELAARAPAWTPRGEYTLVVAPPAAPPPPPVAPATAAAALAEALASGYPLAEARREAARRLGISRRALYELLARQPRRGARAGPR